MYRKQREYVFPTHTQIFVILDGVSLPRLSRSLVSLYRGCNISSLASNYSLSVRVDIHPCVTWSISICYFIGGYSSGIRWPKIYSDGSLTMWNTYSACSQICNYS